jgi:thiol-disulfide isomerase/thioredoxin
MERMRMLLALAPVLLASACARDDAASARGPARAGEPGPRAALGQELEPFAFTTPDGAPLAWDPDVGLRVGAELRTPAALLVHVFQPDCPACQDEARALADLAQRRTDVAVVGLAHRRGADEVDGFRALTGATHPLAHAAGSGWAERWSRGDPTYLADGSGRVVYAQVGFHPSDVAVWEAALADVHAGRSVGRDGPDRPAVVVGERMPRIELPELATRTPVVLDSEGGELVLARGGERRRFRAAIGFFSRY